jgi:hypothetical protein
MLNILPLEENRVFFMKNLTLIAWNMVSCFSMALNSISHREMSARGLTTSDYNERLAYCVAWRQIIMSAWRTVCVKYWIFGEKLLKTAPCSRVILGKLIVR